MSNLEWDSVLHFISDSLHPSPDVNSSAASPPRPLPPPVTCAASPKSALAATHADSTTPGSTIVSVSTTFHPAANLHSSPPDLILHSSDGVFFYAHTSRILAVSKNRFDGLLPLPNAKEGAAAEHDDLGPIVSLAEDATTLNIVLHVFYSMPVAHYSPSLDALIAAVDALAKYGAPPKAHVAPSTHLFALLLAQAPMQPIAAYALAAAYDLYELAVPVSSHLLSYTLASLSDDLSSRIGPLYLKRLFFLHLGRIDALKRLLLPPPHPHPPTMTCDFTEQKKLTRAWALASAYLAWDARPDLSGTTIEAALFSLADHLGCNVCKAALMERVKDLIVQWSFVKRTI